MNSEAAFEEIAVPYLIECGVTLPLREDDLNIRMVTFFYKRGAPFDIEAGKIHPYGRYFLEKLYLIHPPARTNNVLMLEPHRDALAEFFGEEKWEAATEVSDLFVHGLKTAHFVRLYWKQF